MSEPRTPSELPAPVEGRRERDLPADVDAAAKAAGLRGVRVIAETDAGKSDEAAA